MKYLFTIFFIFFSTVAFASKILKNNTASPVFITDTGVTVPASGQHTILPTEDFIFAASNDVIIYISDEAVGPGVSTLKVNDGTSDLGIADGTALIQGFYPKRMQILGDDEQYLADVIQDAASTNRLAVDATAVVEGGATLTFSKKLRYVDMKASSGGVARDTTISTTWTNVFSYSGSGVVVGFSVNMEGIGGGWYIRFLVDSEEIFTSSGIYLSDILDGSVYNMADLKNQPDHGLVRAGNVIRFQLPFPVAYSTSVTVKIKKMNGDKKFQAGLMVLSKES
jgi:hypothetical protein